ncbi:MAG: peptidoglycan DD-metalloendopeptidase family protein [Microlunatus sp.]|nr:peptidoglycan DD-metalloendopeptidase family protein [Microlunatus sp.]MDN5770287.1 peptidoglycan DD-metalloendopeptidase family protein [Microlunatus sp.]
MRTPQITLLVLALALALTGAASSPAAADGDVPATGQWPLTGRVRVISGFSPPAQRWNAGHRGVDLAARTGAPVLAAAGGRVSFAGRLAGRGVVVVDHGQVRTTYEPVDPLVAVGDRVRTGAVIGRLGSGGHCSQRCLHWGLKEADHYLNPLLLVGGGDDTVLRLLAADQAAVARKRTAQRAAETARAERRVATFVSLPNEAGGFARPVPGGITSPFGMRFHPVLHVWKLHDGTDFAAGCGTPIRAPAPGRVAAVSYNRGYGNRLMLDHGSVRGRQIRTGFNHATRYVVGPGTLVKQGQLLGYVGSTGYSTGCHLHLMLWVNGGLANPMTLF